MRPFFPFTAGLLVAAGLLSAAARLEAREPFMTHRVLYPIQEPDCLPFPGCPGQPVGCCTEHVYIFGVNGLDPLCFANFNGLMEYFRKQGFEHTYFGQLHTINLFGPRIAQIRREDPEARIVVIGYSLGCPYVRCLANHLARQGVRIDLLVYLAGDYLWKSPRSFPPNVCRVLNIRTHGIILTGRDLLFNGADVDGAQNYQLDIRHMRVPSRKEVVALVMEEVLAVACAPCGDPPVLEVPALPENAAPAPDWSGFRPAE